MTHWKTMSLAVTMACSMVGCVSQKYADDLELANRRCQEQVVDLKSHLEKRQAEIAALQAGAIDPSLPSQLDSAYAERDRLLQALAAAEDRLRAIGSSPVLEPELDSALIDLARTNPDLMTYDSQLGMVKFQSDLTFALGSADVSATATPSLNKLAGILESPVASQYEARIVGHTDNVRIGKPSTRVNHPTNWHLSVHRAISVKDVLVNAGVPPTRVSVAGYGEYRPIAPNSGKGNQLNRRVEIYLVRGTHDRQAAGQPQPGAASSTAIEPGGQTAPSKSVDAARQDDLPKMFK